MTGRFAALALGGLCALITTAGAVRADDFCDALTKITASAPSFSAGTGLVLPGGVAASCGTTSSSFDNRFSYRCGFAPGGDPRATTTSLAGQVQACLKPGFPPTQNIFDEMGAQVLVISMTGSGVHAQISDHSARPFAPHVDLVIDNPGLN